MTDALQLPDDESQGDDYVGQQRAVDTRRTILETAARLFSEKGFDGCSTRDIATAANVSHANIRYHFGDKEKLWLRVIKFLIAESYHGSEILSAMRESESPMKLFRQHTRNAISYFANHPELPRIIQFEAMIGGERYEMVSGWMRELDKERTGHIIAMQKSGVVKKDIDPEQLNALISGALTNVFVVNPENTKLPKAQKETLIDNYVELIVALVSK